MKEIIVIAAFLCFGVHCVAQQHDNNMVFGNHFAWTPDEDKYGTILNFNDYPVSSISMEQTNINFYSCGYSMSDECGDLIFYSNGLKIVDSTHHTMPNGTGLNMGGIATDADLGYFDPLGMICVPSPNDDNTYYIFHTIALGNDSIGFSTPSILSTKIDMSLNSGKGAVTDKNSSIISGLRLCNLSIARHGNGQDWWLVSCENYDNRYYKVLLSEDSFSLPIVQQIGFKYPYSGINALTDVNSQKLFTPNGEKYIDYDARNGVRIMDFDRCTGEFSNHQWIVFDEFIGNGSGASVSSNSRFLYVTGQQIVLQYDLEAEDINSSVDTVGFFNRMRLGGFPSFTYNQLAPDGKIYIVTESNTEALHIINNPNEKGAACEFLVHGLVTPEDNSIILPRYPNYRLYDLPDSPCDTLGIDGSPEFDCEN